MLRCAAAGNITETVIEQMTPTNEQSKLNEGKNIDTHNAKMVSSSLMVADATSTIRSLDRYGATISSIPNAKGNIVNVTFEKAVIIISHVNAFIAVTACELRSNDKVT